MEKIFRKNIEFSHYHAKQTTHRAELFFLRRILLGFYADLRPWFSRKGKRGDFFPNIFLESFLLMWVVPRRRFGDFERPFGPR